MKAKFLTAVLILSVLFATASVSYAWNQYPEASLKALREYMIVGRRAILNGSDSFDPDGSGGINGIWQFEWDFTDNGSYDYSETSSSYPDGAFDGVTTHIYYSGTYTVRLRVTDNGSPGLTDTDTCTVYGGPDSDNDGLPDDWEELYGLDPNDANDADQHLDSDNYNNLCEYLHGSEPNDNTKEPDPNFPITIYVPADVNSIPSDANSIQRAINASINGDTIVVSEGTYYEVIDFNNRACTLTSTDPNDWNVIANTIIDADNSDANVVTFENSEDGNSVLTGFTITGGARGIYCEVASPTISNCIIIDNGTVDYGAGVYCFDNASPTIKNCVFSGNTASWGGGGILNYISSPTVDSCVFTENSVVADDQNGARGGAICNWEECSTTIRNCVFSGNTANATASNSNSTGGGVFNFLSSPTITNCVFSGNIATATGPYDSYGYGGGMHNTNSSPTVTNCIFSGNSADCGGGLRNWQSSPTVTNCTFSGNHAEYYDGGAMHNYHSSSSPTVTNCIFWDNDAYRNGNEIWNYQNPDPNFSYCDIEGCGGSSGWDDSFGTDGGGNIDSDPCFLDASDPAGPDDVFGTFDDGLRLQTVSPCIDAADGNAPAPSTDIAGRARIDAGYADNTGVGVPDYADIGAYESLMIWFVDKDATGNDDGSSWEDAFTDLQDALGDANDGDGIWVAEGTYKPTSGSNRLVSFELVEGVDVYGRFAGTEISPHQRDMMLHETILSGDIGTPGNQSDNSYHVVKGANNVVLDGFTITGGNANSSSPPDRMGGGMQNWQSSPTVTNCTFSENSAHYGGGMLNCYDVDTNIINCTFTGNEAARGGGMYNYLCDPVLTNCTFSGNSASDDGGGMYNLQSDPALTNCIFWGNDAVTDGNEIYNYSSSSDPTFSYCDIKGCGGSSGWDPNFGSDGGGNIDSDPCFLDVNNPAGLDGLSGTFDDGLRLRGGSPCIDAADGNAAPLEDILGLGRVDINDANTGTGEPNYVDIGAYESYSGYGSDTDGDGLWDYEEYLLGTDPDDWDSDDDELSDGNEFNVHHTNPMSTDTDGDGLSDNDELNVHYTNPLSSDTDSDGMDDGWEVFYDLDPLDGSDAIEDPDDDDKTNLQEYNAGTHPFVYTAISVIVYEYDNAGQVTKETIQDGDGNDVAVTEYQYDGLGRRWQQRRWANVSSSDDANDMITLYSYDVRSNLKETVRKVDPNAIAIEANDLVTENSYDSLGRLTDVNDNGLITQYTYYKGGEPNQVTDPNGNTTTNYYDNAGRLQKIVDEEDHYRLNYYDSLGRTIKQIAYDGNSTPADANDDFALMQTRFEYDGLSHVTRRAIMASADSTSSIDPNIDMVVDYVYDGNNGNYPGMLVSQITYYDGNPCKSATTTFEYDDLGRRTKTTDHAGNQILLTYDEMGRITCQQQIDVNPLEAEPNLVITTDYYYDSLSRLRHQVAVPDVNDSNTWQITTYDYDVLGNRAKETRPNGVEITYGYNALGRLVEKIADAGTDKINQKTEYGYDRLSRQTSITSYADGSTTQTTNYTYDKLARITKVEYPDGHDIDFEYNPAGKVAKRIDQRGIVTTYAYDGTYNMLTKSVNGNSVTDDANETFTYDGLGRMLTATKEVAGLGTISETEFDYNDIGKITDANEKLFNGTKREIDYTYDQAGLPTSIEYPNGSTVNITPDWQGRIDTVKLGVDTIAIYEYIGSRVARRSYKTSTYDTIYQPTYDNLGRITSSRTYRNTTDIAKFDYQYESNTNNISQQKYDHRTNDPCTLFTYDHLNRLTIAEYGIQSEDEVFTMDDLGNRSNVNVRNGYDVTYIVDANTNRYTTLLGNANAGHWKMDDDEPNTTVLDSSGNGNDGTAQQNTSALHTTGKIDGALSFNGDTDYIMVGDKDCLELQEFTLSFWAKHLNPEGNFVGGIAKGYIFGSAVEFSYRMDFGLGLLRAGITNTSDTYFGTYTSLDDSNWHLWTMTVGDSTVSLYKDGAFCDDTAYTGTIDYTKTRNNFVIGARDNGSYAFEGDIDDVMVFDKALTAEEVSMLYNSPDDLSYDDAGNLTKDKDGYEYEYDYENRIVKITKDSSDIAEFAYDALGRRIRKIDSAAGETTLYYYNYNWQVLTEYDGFDNLQRKFIYGNYIDEVLLMIADGNDYYYAHNHLYSPAALIDSSGTVLERYEYDAYGTCQILDASYEPRETSDYNNPYLFTGRRLDILDNSSLKIQYNRNRYYDYYTGRWLTHDPLGIVPNSEALNYFNPDNQYSQGLSLYEYVLSNPVIGSDPWAFATFDKLIDLSYKTGSDPPPDGDWEHGEWDSVPHPFDIRTTQMLRSIKTRAYITALFLSGWAPDAKRHLLHYLGNTGERLDIDYIRMLRVSKEARIDWKRSLQRAMQYAEKVAVPDVSTPIVQKGHARCMVLAPDNWRLAIQTYHTWGRGSVRKGKGRKSCCYYMTWILYLRDNYEFADDPWAFAGFVWDSELHDLNIHGWARHFKIRGLNGIRLTWAKGYRLKKDDLITLIEGRQKPFPQCQ